MRSRRQRDFNAGGRAGRIAVVVASHPREFVAAMLAGVATITIFVNALFMQRGPHPAPIFAMHSPAVAGGKADRAPVTTPRTVEARVVPVPPPRAVPAATQPKAAATQETAHEDKIAELISSSSKRVLAVQRALSDFGYGQIRPTGTFGPDTRAAIEKFESGHRMPVTGQISERLMRELAAMIGRPLE